MNKIALIVGPIVALAIIFGGIFFYGVGVENSYIDLENRYTKQTAKIESFHDKMWKTIKSQTKVTDKMKDAFKEIYVPLMEGRYANDSGQFMKWIQESNPQFDQAAYAKLMTTIEAQRTGFHNEQTIMQQVVKEMNDKRLKFPSKFWVGDKPEVTFAVISSSASKNVMETRLDDSLHLDD